MAFVRTPYQFDDFDSLAADNTNKSLTAAKVADAAFVLITCETQPVQYRLDGGDATADGHSLAVGESLELEGHNNITNFRFSRDTGVNGTLKVSYAKEIAV